MGNGIYYLYFCKTLRDTRWCWSRIFVIAVHKWRAEYSGYTISISIIIKLSSSTKSSESSSLGYVDVSRAVPTSKELDTSTKTSHRQWSENILNVNLLRAVPGNPHQIAMTTISHVNVPSVPFMVATPVGIKGAIDFVKDLRALGKTIKK